jgi:thiol-disulfide isomerase/thioredoxin
VRLPDLQGRSHQLTRWKGRLVLLNFWLTTCRPCLEEMPSLLELANRHQGKGLVLVLVSTDKKKKDIDAFIKKVPRLANPPANVVMLHDQGGKLAKRLGTKKFPETYVISPEGRLAGVAVGPRDWTGRAATTCIADKLP